MILIRCEDRDEFGYGNRSRAIAIAQHCIRNKLEYSLIYSNEVWGKQLASDYNCTPLSCQSGTKEEAKELLKKNPLSKSQNNYIFCDGNRFLKSFFVELKKINIKTILLDDLGYPIRDFVDCVINPNIYATREFYLKWGTKIFAGTSNVLLREEFFKPIEKIKLRPSVLISLGGTGKVELIDLIKKKLTNKGFKVFIAKGFSAIQMVEAIDKASFVICGASVGLHEVISRERIPIPIYQVDDQIYFVKYLKKKKFPYIDGLNRKHEDVAMEIISLINYFTDNNTNYSYKKYQFHKESLNSLLKFFNNEI